VVWVFLPFNRSVHEDAARSIFRNDMKPDADHPAAGDGQGA
jgi:hypothetical protein